MVEEGVPPPAAAAKGTVTELSSLFPAEEAQRASERVQGTIAERQRELQQLASFIGDNTGLINLVQKLPDELHHHIMVPFGKAAFFPGRLVHTNEFLVLLGEGYYAERTSKQTVDILKRRGKTLESQVESLKAVMQDLKAEASFFDTTAAEVAEGLVEIREEYMDESLADKGHKTDSRDNFVGEDEYARMMARFDELEKEELAAESMAENEEDEENDHMIVKIDELEEEYPVENASKKGDDECISALFGQNRNQKSFHHKDKTPEGNLLNDGLKQSKEEHAISEELRSKLIFRQDLRNLGEKGIPVQVCEDNSSSDNYSEPANSSSQGKEIVVLEVKENDQVEPQTRTKMEAFTGLIVEHTHNLKEQSESSSKSPIPTTSKPVSRFKMQRR